MRAVPLFLEPVSSNPGALDVRNVEYARRKTELVADALEEFSETGARCEYLDRRPSPPAEFRAPVSRRDRSGKQADALLSSRE